VPVAAGWLARAVIVSRRASQFVKDWVLPGWLG
jgi:hypothetical protein